MLQLVSAIHHHGGGGGGGLGILLGVGLLAKLLQHNHHGHHHHHHHHVQYVPIPNVVFLLTKRSRLFSCVKVVKHHNAEESFNRQNDRVYSITAQEVKDKEKIPH
ncbi:hypothetical protein TNCV_383791 [Trichonephila clavipes]|nr:hypothetical protein TNCV_383791 [Trichonephila clavipes]